MPATPNEVKSVTCFPKNNEKVILYLGHFGRLAFLLLTALLDPSSTFNPSPSQNSHSDPSKHRSVMFIFPACCQDTSPSGSLKTQDI